MGVVTTSFRMDTPSGIEVGADGAVRILRVTGRGTHLNSPLLKRFARQALEQKLSLHFDLGACTYMDSTFLGMLAGLAVKAREGGLPRILVLQASPRVRDLMENLGIDRLFDFAKGLFKEGASLQPLDPRIISSAEKSRDVLDAHRTLVSVSPANEVKFRDVIALLEEEIARTPPSL